MFINGFNRQFIAWPRCYYNLNIYYLHLNNIFFTQ